MDSKVSGTGIVTFALGLVLGVTLVYGVQSAASDVAMECLKSAAEGESPRTVKECRQEVEFMEFVFGAW